MKRIIIFYLLMMSSIFAQDKILTLKESIELGIQNSKELKISNAKMLSSEAKVAGANSQLLPQLKFQASYQKLSNIAAFTIDLPFSPQPIQLFPVILNNYNLKLSLQQPIFTGFRLSSLKSEAEDIYESEQLNYENDLNETAFNIQKAFWDYYKTKEIKKVLEENLKLTQQHLDDTKNFMQNGLATKNDFLKLEVQYSNTKLQLIDAENNVDLAKINFNRLLGLPLESNTEVKVEKIDTAFVKYNLNEIINEAKENRHDLKSFEYKVQASNEAISAASSGWFPAVYLTGNLYYSRPNQRIIPAEDKFKETWDVGVSLSWDLWNWGYTSSKQTQAEQQKVQVETALSQLKDIVEVEVYESFLNYKKSLDKIRVGKLSVEQAGENYNSTKKKYNQQIASSTDLIDSEVSLTQAKTNLAVSIVDYEIARIKLQKAIGRKIY